MTSSRPRDYRSRNFVFTLNNYTENDIEVLVDLTIHEKVFRYIAWGEEIAPSTGTPHLQGWLCFEDKKSWNQVMDIFHFSFTEHMKGSLDQNESYVLRKKNPRFFEFGDKPRQGMKKASSKTEEMFHELKTEKILPYDAFMKYGHIYAKNYKAYEHCMGLAPKSPAYSPKEVVVIWGDTEVGKSRKARQFFDQNDMKYYVKGVVQGNWFTDYLQEPGVIFEEFNDEQMPIEHFLELTDCYPSRVQVKGGMLNFAPKKIIFTSQDHPDNWYAMKPQKKRDAMLRRINGGIFHIT